jgi:PilZ domain
MRYRLFKSKVERVAGVGETVDISSNGIAFITSEPLPPARVIEVSLDWPACLDGKYPLQFVASGRIVRCTATTVAIRIRDYQFKLRATALAAS